MSWFLLQCKSRQEPMVAQRLAYLDYETYLPWTLADKRYKAQTYECMFPTYLFIKMRLGIDDFHPVTKVKGVLRFIKLAPKDGYFYPTVVPDAIIDRFKLMEDEMGINTSFKSDYAEGDKIRIKSGPMAGYEGLVKKLKSGLSGEQRALILIGALQCEVRTREIEPA